MLTGLCAIAVVVTQNIVRSATWLLFTLAGTSGIFFLLGADFVGGDAAARLRRRHAGAGRLRRHAHGPGAVHQHEDQRRGMGHLHRRRPAVPGRAGRRHPVPRTPGQAENRPPTRRRPARRATPSAIGESLLGVNAGDAEGRPDRLALEPSERSRKSARTR